MRVVDLFCGAGGFSLGLRQEGFEVVAGYDNEPKAIAVHRTNLPHTPGMAGFRSSAPVLTAFPPTRTLLGRGR